MYSLFNFEKERDASTNSHRQPDDLYFSGAILKLAPKKLKQDGALDWISWLNRVWFNLYILSVYHPGCESRAMRGTGHPQLLTHLPSPRFFFLNITAPWELKKIWQDQQDDQLCIWESDRGVPAQRHSGALIELQFPSTGKLHF